MQRIYGTWAANLVTALVMWTAFASVFSLMLGYSRVPYAAALDGNYFKVFSRVHPVYQLSAYFAAWRSEEWRCCFAFFACRRNLGAGGHSYSAAIPPASDRRHCAARSPARYAAPISHVAVSAARAAGIVGFRLHRGRRPMLLKQIRYAASS